MNVIVAHISLNSAGGGELVCLSLIRVLRKAGNGVTLVTVDRTDWTYLRKIFGETAFPDREFYLLSNMPKTHFIMLHSVLLLTFYFAELFLLRLLRKGDLLISTCGEKINSIADIVYVNGTPLRCASFLFDAGIKRKYYGKLYDLLLRVVDRFNSSLVIANSKFNKRIIRRCMNRDAWVVYPPVDIQKFIGVDRGRHRENTVVAVSRFLPDQNLDYIPKLAKFVQNSNFLVIGPSGTTSKRTVEELNEMITKLAVKDQVKIVTNQPFSRLLEALSTAKVFLRTQPCEPFGMAVVEAMAAGCVPVVPKAGGPWFDILNQEQGKYGYAYSNLKEAAEEINTLMNDERLRIEISRRAVKRAKFFDRSFFERRIVEIFHRVAVGKLKVIGEDVVHENVYVET
jgi:glycosyltransferase involved in cell wall biosynthesis